MVQHFPVSWSYNIFVESNIRVFVMDAKSRDFAQNVRANGLLRELSNVLKPR